MYRVLIKMNITSNHVGTFLSYSDILGVHYFGLPKLFPFWVDVLGPYCSCGTSFFLVPWDCYVHFCNFHGLQGSDLGVDTHFLSAAGSQVASTSSLILP